MVQAAYGNVRVPKQIRVPCADVFNRRRFMGMARLSSTGRIALVAPPGETAVLTPHEARELAQQLLVMAGPPDAQDVTQLADRRPTG